MLALPPGELASNTISLACSPDGKSLAGIVGGLLVRWDMSKGTLLDSFRAPRPGHMQWCGERHILVHGELVDLDVKVAVSSYDRPLVRIHYGSPDGRAWFTTSRARNAVALTAQTLPDAAAREGIALLKQPGAEVVLRPGMSVSLQVSLVGAGARTEEVRRRTQDAVINFLGQYGIRVADGQPATLQVSLQEAATGKTTIYKPVGKPGPDQIVQLKQVNAQVTLTVGGGIAWQEKSSVATPEIPTLRTDDVQAELDTHMWTFASAWVGRLNPPGFLVRIGTRLEQLPRKGTLTGDQ